MPITYRASCPALLVGLEFSVIKIFRFLSDFGQICEFWPILRRSESGKKMRSRKKKVSFPKVKCISSTVPKYEPLTPSELGDIVIPAKIIFFLEKKNILVNSLIFIFKDFRARDFSPVLIIFNFSGKNLDRFLLFQKNFRLRRALIIIILSEG